MMTAGELASYYRAAVEYIDPRLREDCPVEDIRAAAAARCRALQAHDSSTARLELEKIDEALQFITRIHPDITETDRAAAMPGEAGTSAAAHPVQLPVGEENGDGKAEVTTAPQPAAMAAIDIPPSGDQDTRPEDPGLDRRTFLDERRRRRGEEQDHVRELAAEIEQELHTHERVDRIIESLPDTADSIARELDADVKEESGELDFRSLMEKARSSTGVTIRPARARRLRTEEILSRTTPRRRIPEEHASPILLGMLLILWQFGAALLAGYAVCRLLAWPLGTPVTDLPPFRILAACLLGLGTASMVGIWIRAYRRRSHKLSLPTHVTAVSASLVLLSWQLQAAPAGETGPPPIWLWCLLFACWIVATVAAGIHDLRVPPVLPAEEKREIGTEPAGHLQG